MSLQTLEPAAAAPLPPAAPTRRRRRPRGRSSRSRAIAWAVGVGLIGAVPVVMLLLASFDVSGPGEDTRYGLGNWRAAFSNEAMRKSIVTTLELGVTRTVIGTVLAVVLAWLIARSDMPGRKLVEVMMFVAFVMPTLPTTLGWILLLDPQNGTLNTLLRHLPGLGGRPGPLDIYSFKGIVWVHLTSSTVPLMTILLVPAFRRMAASFEEVARTCGAGRFRTASRVTVPLMAPAILSAATLSFIWSLKSFEVELLLGRPIGLQVYSTQIYQLMTDAPPEFGTATALGSAFIFVIIALAVGQRYVLRGRSFTTITTHSWSARPVGLGPVGRWVTSAVVMLLVLVGVGLPIVFVVVGSFMRRFGFFDLDHPFTTDNWSQMVHDPIFTSAVGSTLLIGVLTTLFGMVVYLAVANVAVRSNLRTSGLVDTFAWLPVAIPGILLGLGLLYAYLKTPLSGFLYGTTTGIVIALVIGHMSTGVQQMKSALLQVSADHEQAARTCGAGRVRTSWQILLPLIAPSLVAAATLTFASAIREVSTVVLLSSSGGREPLAVLMLEYSFGGQLERGAALGVLISVVVIVVGAIAQLLTSGRLGSSRRLGRSRAAQSES
jgi:iron(III) transport system permease protein